MIKTTLLLAACAAGTLGFTPSARPALSSAARANNRVRRSPLPLRSSPEPTGDVEPAAEAADAELVELTPEEEEKLGNLVADEEWAGLSMELAEVVKVAVVEDLKKNSRDFLGKDDYAMGDFSKEIDRRVKDEVAKLREKDEYELGDLSVVLDDKVKELVCEMSGKEEYEFGDLSVEIDKRVKESVAVFCGKDSYEFGDLSKELAKRTQKGVLEYTGKSSYKFGDISKQFAKNLTGKDEYQFGDISKKLFGNMMNKKGGK
ncbi:hypothetical protein ACHAXT_007503 [Thalassiosira profunda]